MKKSFKYAVLVLICVLVFLGVSRVACNARYLNEANVHEQIAYCVFAFAFVVLVRASTSRIKGLGVKLGIFAVCSLVFSTGVFFANNLWKYLSFNSVFPQGSDGLTYKSFLISDLSYNYGLGEYRYLFVFALMLAALTVIELLMRKGLKARFDRWSESLHEWICMKSFISDDLEDLYLEAREYAIKRVIRYVDDMPHTEKGKRKLMALAYDYEEAGPVYLLLKKYGDMLTREEYIKYKKLYSERFDKYIKKRKAYDEKRRNITAIITELDDKFGIKD